MAAYVIFDVDIKDPVMYGEYMLKVKPAIEAAGGKYLARGGPHKVYHGDWQPYRIVLLEFPSVEAFETFVSGDVYQGLKEIREKASVSRAVIVQGV